MRALYYLINVMQTSARNYTYYEFKSHRIKRYTLPKLKGATIYIKEVHKDSGEVRRERQKHGEIKVCRSTRLNIVLSRRRSKLPSRFRHLPSIHTFLSRFLFLHSFDHPAFSSSLRYGERDKKGALFLRWPNLGAYIHDHPYTLGALGGAVH